MTCEVDRNTLVQDQIVQCMSIEWRECAYGFSSLCRRQGPQDVISVLTKSMLTRSVASVSHLTQDMLPLAPQINFPRHPVWRVALRDGPASRIENQDTPKKRDSTAAMCLMPTTQSRY